MAFWENLARKSIKFHEGLRLDAYEDMGGISVGYGHSIKSSDPESALAIGDTISQDRADEFFEQDFEIALKDAKSLVKRFDELPIAMKVVATDMSYNLGRPRLKTFKRMLKELNRFKPNPKVVAREMLDSKWATQVPGRAENLANYVTRKAGYGGIR